MEVIALIIYNCFYQLKLPEDTEALQQKILHYSQNFYYNIGIITEQNLSILQNNYGDTSNYLQVKQFLDNIISILFKSLYSIEEQKIIVGFCLCYSFPKLINKDINYLTFLESLLTIVPSKEEITYCLEEIKYKVATYYILNNIKQEEALQLLEELEEIEDRHNSMNIFEEINEDQQI